MGAGRMSGARAVACVVELGLRESVAGEAVRGGSCFLASRTQLAPAARVAGGDRARDEGEAEGWADRCAGDPSGHGRSSASPRRCTTRYAGNDVRGSAIAMRPTCAVEADGRPNRPFPGPASQAGQQQRRCRSTARPRGPRSAAALGGRTAPRSATARRCRPSWRRPPRSRAAGPSGPRHRRAPPISAEVAPPPPPARTSGHRVELACAAEPEGSRPRGATARTEGERHVVPPGFRENSPRGPRRQSGRLGGEPGSTAPRGARRSLQPSRNGKQGWAPHFVPNAGPCWFVVRCEARGARTSPARRCGGSGGLFSRRQAQGPGARPWLLLRRPRPPYPAGGVFIRSA